MVVQGIVLCLLLSFGYQDFKYRAIYFFCFPILLILGVVVGMTMLPSEDLATNTVWNLGFLLSQLLMLTVYFSIRQRGWVDITKDLLGWGDVLFLVCSSTFFSPVNYLLFYVFSLFAVLLLVLFYRVTVKRKMSKIPLAGMQATIMGMLLILDWNATSINAYNDDWFLQYFI